MTRVVQWALAVVVFVAGIGCSSFVSSPTHEDSARRAVASVKLALTAAYTTTEDFLIAHRISQDDARSVYRNLERAQNALASAEMLIVSDPTSAQRYIDAALEIVTDILADLQRRKDPPVIAPGAVDKPPPWFVPQYHGARMA